MHVRRRIHAQLRDDVANDARRLFNLSHASDLTRMKRACVAGSEREPFVREATVRRRSGFGEDDNVRADDPLAAAGQRKNDPVMNFSRSDVETRAEKIFKRHHRQIASVIVATAIAFRLAYDAHNLSRVDDAISHQPLEMADIRRPFGWNFECLYAHDCQSL